MFLFIDSAIYLLQLFRSYYLYKLFLLVFIEISSYDIFNLVSRYTLFGEHISMFNSFDLYFFALALLIALWQRKRLALVLVNYDAEQMFYLPFIFLTVAILIPNLPSILMGVINNSGMMSVLWIALMVDVLICNYFIQLNFYFHKRAKFLTLILGEGGGKNDILNR